MSRQPFEGPYQGIFTMKPEQMDLPFVRVGKTVWLAAFPPNVTEENVLEEFSAFGNIVGLDENPATGTFGIHYSHLAEAVQLERYMLNSYINDREIERLLANQNTGIMSGMGAVGGARPFRRNVFASRNTMPTVLPLTQAHMSPPNIQVMTTGDGIRQITSPLSRMSTRSYKNAADTVESDHSIKCGPCHLCKKRTSYTCGRCGVFYCSRECQTQDWSSHKDSCNSGMPPLNFAPKMKFQEVESPQLGSENRVASPSANCHGDVNAGNSQRSAHREQQVPRAYNGDQGDHKKQPNFSSQTSVEGINSLQSNDMQGNRQGFGEHVKGQRGNGDIQGDKNSVSYHQGGRQGFGDRQGDRRDNCDRPSDMQGNRQIKGGIERTSFNGRQNSSQNENSMVTPSPKRINGNGSVEGSAATESGSKVEPSTTQKKQPAVGASTTAPVSQPIIKNGQPDTLHLIPSNVAIAKGLKVAVSHIEGNTVYLRSQEDEHVNQLSLLSLSLQKHCATAKPLGRLPKRGELVATKFSADGFFYRAAAEKRTDRNENKFLVRFIDYGNSEVVSIDQMVLLTDNLAQVPVMCVPSILKGVPGDSFTSEAMNLLSRHLAAETAFVVDFAIDIGDGVTLIGTDGSSLNDRIKEVMQESSVPLISAIPTNSSVPTPPSTPITAPAVVPSPAPAVVPSPAPAVVPSPAPAVVPSPAPAVVLSPAPAVVPSPAPAVVPSPAPAVVPSPAPVVVPSPAPVVVPSPAPAVVPSPAPAVVPSPAPAVVPSSAPAVVPSVIATASTVSAAASPSTSTTHISKDRITMDQLPATPFPPVGTKLKVLICSLNKQILMACPSDEKLFDEICDMQVKIDNYASSAQPYRPVETELCIAKWTDDAWYRAVVLGPKSDDTCEVLFIEYGNIDTVKYSDIRQFTEDFLKVNGLSSMCFLSGPELNPGQVEKLEKMHKDGWVVEATVADQGESTGIVVLDIPEIQNNL